MIGIFLHSRYLSCRLKRPSPFLSLCARLRDVFRVETSSRNRSDVCSDMFELFQRLVTPKYTMSQCEVIEYLSISLVYQNICFFLRYVLDKEQSDLYQQSKASNLKKNLHKKKEKVNH